MFSLNEIDMKIVEYILINQKVHYQDIANLTGLSRSTISKHLNSLNEVCLQLGVRLIRRRGEGIYFEGDTVCLLDKFHDYKEKNFDRSNGILTRLLFREKPITVQDLADQLFVSRNTLQNDMKVVRKTLRNNHLRISVTTKGILISGTEEDKRHLMSEILDDSLVNRKNENVFDRRWDKVFNAHFLNKVSETLRFFLNELTINYTDYKFKNLVIHIAITIQRTKMDRPLIKHMPYLSEQLSETTKLVEKIEKTFDISLSSPEVNYLNLHMASLMDYKLSDSVSKNYEISDIRRFLQEALKDQKADETLISDLTLHLFSTLNRLTTGLSVRNPYLEETKQNFPYSFEIAADLSYKMQTLFKLVIPEDEVAYIALHFQSFIERQAANSKIDTVIVCNTGLGSSRFLEQRIESVYKNEINIVGVLSIADLKRCKTSVPLVLTTIEFNMPLSHVVVVSPLLNEFDKEKINQSIENITARKEKHWTLTSLISQEQIYFNESVESLEDAIVFLGNKLIESGMAKKGILESALKREKIALTTMGRIATPHGSPDFVNECSLSTLVSKKGIDWGGKKVNVVFFIALNHSVLRDIRKVYKHFSKLITPEFVKKAVKCDESQELYDLIIESL